MKNILYLGRFYPKNLLKTLFEDSKGKAGMSNHNFEMSLLNGLCLQDNIHLKCVTIPGVFSYPYNNKNIYTYSEEYAYKNTFIHSAGFCNLPVIKDFWATRNCVKVISKIIDDFDSGDDIHVVINTPSTILMDALNIVRKKYSRRFTQTVIIPDIPSMITSMDNPNPIKHYLLDRINERAMEMTSNSEGLVVLTEAMMEFITKPVKHIVMEGIVDIETMDKIGAEEASNKKIILYTGTLRKIFGVVNLVDAFQKIPDKDAELWICGSGDSKEYIQEAARQDYRIKFFGLVDSKTALEMQHKATILVNPRTSEGEFTKYSFPSKTMEYLLAGKSVVINRIPGIPEEYFNYVYTPKDESIEALAECLLDVLHLDSDIREKRALDGRNFIVEKKNSKVQVKRIIELINSYN